MPVLFVAAVLLLNNSGIAEDLKVIALSSPDITAGKPLMTALSERKTTRSFSSRDLSIDVISNLLWAAFGVNRPESGKRTAPSAMNRQEIDIYVAMKSGLYLYNARENRLDSIRAKDIREYAGTQEFTQKASVDIIYVADFSKMAGDENTKMFYSAVDTGFISQNVYLFCASEGLSTVILGWVDKPALEKIMNLRPDQKVILTQPVGYPE